VYVLLYLPQFQFLSQLTNFYETRHERHAIEDRPQRRTVYFRTVSNTSRVYGWTCEAIATVSHFEILKWSVVTDLEER
jgi:hypothetical protein